MNGAEVSVDPQVHHHLLYESKLIDRPEKVANLRSFSVFGTLLLGVPPQRRTLCGHQPAWSRAAVGVQGKVFLALASITVHMHGMRP